MRRLVIVVLLCAGAAVGAQQPKQQSSARKVDSVSAVNSGQWVASKKGHTYYRTGCKGSAQLAVKSLVYFKSEDDARRAGYTRSRAKGC